MSVGDRNLHRILLKSIVSSVGVSAAEKSLPRIHHVLLGYILDVPICGGLLKMSESRRTELPFVVWIRWANRQKLILHRFSAARRSWRKRFNAVSAAAGTRMLSWFSPASSLPLRRSFGHNHLCKRSRPT